MQGGFSYSGQRCTAVKVVLVMEEVADELVKKVNKGVEELTVGMPEVLLLLLLFAIYHHHHHHCRHHRRRCHHHHYHCYYDYHYHCHHSHFQARPPPLEHASAWLLHNHAWLRFSAVLLNTLSSAGGVFTVTVILLYCTCAHVGVQYLRDIQVSLTAMHQQERML